MVNMDNYEEYLLLYADGELSAAEQKELFAFIDWHPELRAEMDMYAATKLVPDESIVYTGKEQLMKSKPAGRSITFKKLWVYTTAAACLALLIALGLRNYNDRGETPQIARAITEHKIDNTSDTNAYKELHSIPKNPVAVETKKEPVKPAPGVAKNKPVTQTHIIAPKHAPVVAKAGVQVKQSKVVPTEQSPVATPPVIPEKNIIEPIAVAKGQEETIDLPTVSAPKSKRGLLAVLPAKENMSGINSLSQNVSEKFEKIKDIPDKIRNTDVRFKIGKKELFVVRL